MTHALAPAMPLAARGPAAAGRALPHAAFAIVIAAVLACGVGIANMPSSRLTGLTGGVELPQAPGPLLAVVPTVAVAQRSAGARAGRCANCGVVESIRALEVVGSLPAAFEFTVRLRDGSVRVSRTIGQGHWRPGDRIMLLGGAPSTQ